MAAANAKAIARVRGSQGNYKCPCKTRNFARDLSARGEVVLRRPMDFIGHTRAHSVYYENCPSVRKRASRRDDYIRTQSVYSREAATGFRLRSTKYNIILCCYIILLYMYRVLTNFGNTDFLHRIIVMVCTNIHIKIVIRNTT